MGLQVHNAPLLRPRIAAMIRLVRAVQIFKACLKKRGSAKRQVPQLHKLNCLIAADEAYAGLNKTKRDPRAHKNIAVGSKALDEQGDGWEERYIQDRNEIDRFALFSAGSCTSCAADSGLLLSATPVCATPLVDTAHCATELQRMETLMDKVRAWTDWSRKPDSPVKHTSGSMLQELLDEVLVANLEHLLRRYICMLLDMFVQALLYFHRSLVEHLHRISIYFGEGWFFEWPDHRRPLSSTWPWNVKPSLVILWGVCWMFWGPGPTDQRSSRYQSQNRRRPRQQGHPRHPQPGLSASTTDPQPVAQADVFGGDFGGGSHPFSEGQEIIASPRVPHSAPGAVCTGDSFAGLTGTLGYLPDYNTGQTSFAGGGPASSEAVIDTLQTSNAGYIDPFGPYTHTAEPQDYYYSLGHPTGTPSGANVPIPVPYLEQPIQQDISGYISEASWPSSRGVSMPSSSYPSPGVSPNDDVSSERPSMQGTVFTHSPALEDSLLTPSMRRVRSSESSIKREGEPPRNLQGQLYCAHESCADDSPIFARHYEWSKHMDKHDRPYHCDDPMCSKLQGFTYSGGLLRHQREVHQKEGEGRQTLMCPHANCKRSTGKGFTRRENLIEHIRRVHKGAGDEHLLKAGNSREGVRASRGGAEKRKRAVELGEESSPPRTVAAPEDLRREVAVLRAEVKRVKAAQEETAETTRRLVRALGLPLGR